MLRKTKGIRSFFLAAATIVFQWILSGIAFAQSVAGNSDANAAGVREVVIGGLIIAFLTAVYSVILTQKGEEEDGEACGCGRKSKYT